jgi:hypothetical protein
MRFAPLKSAPLRLSGFFSIGSMQNAAVLFLGEIQVSEAFEQVEVPDATRRSVEIDLRDREGERGSGESVVSEKPTCVAARAIVRCAL